MTSAYDVYIGGISTIQGYRCKSLLRDTAPIIAPKFASGAAGQTDLDLLKSASVDNLAGGMFQRTHVDPQKVARAVGFYNSFDENFYPTLPTSSASGTPQTGTVICKTESESYAFVNYYQRSGGASYNGISKFVGNVASSLTVPAALYGVAAQTQVSGLCLHKGFLFLAASPGGGTFVDTNSQRYDIAANTWQDIGGFVSQFFTLRGGLYAINRLSQVFSVTNELIAGAANYTVLAAVGGTDVSVQQAVEFNGAAWVTKPDGLYRFDGLSCIKVLTLYAQKLTVWNGALFFMVGKWLYRFDGTNVTKLQYFTDTINSISCDSQYLFLQSWVTTSYIDSPKLPTSTGFARIYAYDGVAWTICLEKDITPETSFDHVLVYSNNYLLYSQPEFSGAAWDNNQLFPVNLANIFTSSAVASTSQIDITSSEHDDGFPNIYKSLEVVEVDYSGLVNGDVITVKYQLYDGKTWGSWITAGVINFASATPYLEITDLSNKLYKRVKINAYVSTMTAASTLSVKGLSWRYSLQPRMRWRWQIQFMAEGNNNVSDRNNTLIAADSNYFTNHVLKTAKQKTPIFMFSPDYGKIDVTVNSAALTFVVLGQIPLYTDPYSEYQLCAVLNASGVWEIMRVATAVYSSGTDKTTVTVVERGYYGVTPASLNANAEFHLAYKVYVTRVLRDQPILDDTTYAEQTSGESQLQREFLLEITEV